MNVEALDVLVVGGRRLTLRRAWPCSPGHLVLEYVEPCGALVAGQWLAETADRRHIAATTPGAVVVAGTGVLLQPAGADRRLPGLAPVLSEPGARLISHRAERRAVVRAADGTYVKVVRPGRSHTIAKAAATAAAALAGVARVPELLAHDPDQGLLIWSPLPGATLHERAATASTDPRWDECWWHVGRVLQAMHRAPPTEGVTVRDVAVERRAANRWLLAARTQGMLPNGPSVPHPVPASTPPVTLHGDLHDKQVLIDTTGTRATPGLLDLDELSVGEAAIDVANLLVHLELRVRQGRLGVAAAATARAAFLDGLSPDTGTMSRVSMLVDVVRLRLAGLCAFRPPARQVARELHDTAITSMTSQDRCTAAAAAHLG